MVDEHAAADASLFLKPCVESARTESAAALAGSPGTSMSNALRRLRCDTQWSLSPGFALPTLRIELASPLQQSRRDAG